MIATTAQMTKALGISKQRESGTVRRPGFIYALTDPQSEEVRYIGWTTNLRKRFNGHCSDAKRCADTHKAKWIESLRRVGLAPEIFIVTEVECGWSESERFWITFFRALGCRLTNATDGGDGILGCKRSPECRAKISAARAGKKLSPEHRAKLSAAKLGTKRHPEAVEKGAAKMRGRKLSVEMKARLAATRRSPSPETRAKLSAAQRGRKHSAEHNEKVAATKRGQKASLETRAKMSRAHLARKTAQLTV